jgi:hypothetical protein
MKKMKSKTHATCSDVIAAYAQMVGVVGQSQAQRVIERFGTRYAATVPPQLYAEAVKDLMEAMRAAGGGRRCI